MLAEEFSGILTSTDAGGHLCMKISMIKVSPLLTCNLNHAE